jgi:3'-5' exoribonuclease
MVKFYKANEIQKLKESCDINQFKSKLQVISQNEAVSSRSTKYLRMSLRDITGEIEINAFPEKYNADINKLKRFFEIGNILDITLSITRKQNAIYLNIDDYTVLPDGQFDLDDFIKPLSLDVDSFVKKLFNTISNIKNQKLKELLEKIFSDDEIKRKYIASPSAIKHHQDYKFGNLEHTIGMLIIFEQYVNFYNKSTLLDVDLIFTGIILHDIGKIEEYKLHNGIIKRTNEGKLYGHLILGDRLISKYIEDIEDFPKDLENRIRHLILSHHGKKEWGAIVEPLFGEAEILHYLDMIDSRFKLNFRPDQWEP